jgi:hypothetical protein
MHNWELYERGNSRRRSDEPLVTIQRRGQISFNPAAMRALGEPEAVIFLIDKNERLLGFRASGITKKTGRRKAVEPGALVRPPGATVAAIPVLKHMEVDLGVSRRYRLVELDGTHCIDLKQPGEAVTSNRRKSAPA